MQYEPATILMVEDEEADYVLTLMLLKNRHIRNDVLRVRSGQDALDLLISGILKSPLILLLDINMPLMSGIQFLDAFQKLTIPNQVAIFILSDHDPDYIKALLGSRQVAGILQKDEVHNFIHGIGHNSRLAEAIIETQTWTVVEMTS